MELTLITISRLLIRTPPRPLLLSHLLLRGRSPPCSLPEQLLPDKISSCSFHCQTTEMMYPQLLCHYQIKTLFYQLKNRILLSHLKMICKGLFERPGYKGAFHETNNEMDRCISTTLCCCFRRTHHCAPHGS